MADEVIEAIETHKFLPVRKLQWRNAKLEFGSPKRLLDSLEQHTNNEWLTRARDADDVVALKSLLVLPEVQDRLRDPRDLRLLWDVCRIPRFSRHLAHRTCRAVGPRVRVPSWAGPG